MKYGDKVLYRFIDEITGEWRQTSWNKFFRKTEEVALGLLAAGIKPGDNVAVCSPNCPQMLAIDYAIFMVRGVSVPINPRDSQQLFDHIMKLTDPKVLFVGDKKQFSKAMKYVKKYPESKLDKIVLIWESEDDRKNYSSLAESIETFEARGLKEGDRNELNKRIEDGSSSDLALILFNNVAHGMPKGAMIGHDQLQAAIDMHDKFMGDSIHEGQLSISYLPLTHIFEKAWLYMCLYRGLTIAFCYNENKVYDMLQQLHPDIVRCVPRFWENFYNDFVDYYLSRNWIGKRRITRAFHVGKKRNLYYRRTGRKTPRWVEMEYRYWDKRIFRKLREHIGLVNNKGIYPTSGSLLNDKIVGFLLKAGFDIYFGYGLVETTVPVSIFPVLHPIVGTVGRPLKGTKIKISNDGEVLVKGPTVMRGYYKDDEGTKAVFDEEGYLHTGDMGYLTPGESLVINGRRREIYKTSTGKIIPAASVENVLMESPILRRVLTVADARPYVTALVYPEMKELKRIAEEKGWKFNDDAELLTLKETKQLLMEEIEAYQKDLSEYMKVRNIVVIPRDISREKGEISVSGKVRRKTVHNHFLKQIDCLYPGEHVEAAPLFDLHQPF